MLNVNQKGSEVVALSARISPVSQGVGAVSSGWVPAKDFHRFMAMVIAGVLGAAATLDAKIEQATSSGGAGVKDVPNRAITQLTKAGADDNKEAVINVDHDDLDTDGGFNHIRLTLTVGVAASLVAGTLQGVGARFGPASDTDAATVDEIVG
jgi:hypothetical protein